MGEFQGILLDEIGIEIAALVVQDALECNVHQGERSSVRHHREDVAGTTWVELIQEALHRQGQHHRMDREYEPDRIPVGSG